MMTGEEYLELIYKESRTKSLEIDIKIPEIFVLSTSVIIVYLSTLTNKNLLFLFIVFLFFCVILLSLLSLWEARKMHTTTVFVISGALDKLRIYKSTQFNTQEEAQNELMKITEENKKESKIGKFKHNSIKYQRLAFLCFSAGLILLLVHSFWDELIGFFSSLCSF